MSTRMMALCWPLQMPPTPKAVLVSLADNANDAGECWPSIATIGERTCFGKTAVIEAIRWLEEQGALKADRSNGRHTRYVLYPDRFASRTGAPPEPVRLADATGPSAGPDRSASRSIPVRQADTNRQEPSRTTRATKKRADAPPPVPQPDDVTAQTWADWLTLRKAKRAPVTDTVLDHARREAAKAGLSLERFLQIWCGRGSVGLEADWLKPHERAGPAPEQPSKQLRGVAAILRVNPDDLAEKDNARSLVRDADRTVLGESVPAQPRRLPGG